MTGHGSVNPLSQQVWSQLLRLTGNITVAAHVAVTCGLSSSVTRGALGVGTVTIVLDIAVDHLVQGTKCGNVWVGGLVNHHDLNTIFCSTIYFTKVLFSWFQNEDVLIFPSLNKT